jgi:hypothetical protein
VTLGASSTISVVGFVTLATELAEITAMAVDQTTTLPIDSDALEKAGWGIAAASAVVGLGLGIKAARAAVKAALDIGARRGSVELSNVAEIGDEAFEAAAKKYDGDPYAMTAWRLTHTSEGNEKTYYHYTKSEAAQRSIGETGFEAHRRNRQYWGPGGYFARTQQGAAGYGEFGLRVKPVLRTAAKINLDRRGGYNLRNPFYRKSGPRSNLPKHLEGHLTHQKLLSYATKKKLDATYINMKGFLVVKNETADGSIPTSNIDVITDAIDPVWDTY